MAKILCELYDDPVHSYPGSCARDVVPTILIRQRADCANTPAVDFIRATF
jgi:hypothetical protein